MERILTASCRTLKSPVCSVGWELGGREAGWKWAAGTPAQPGSAGGKWGKMVVWVVGRRRESDAAGAARRGEGSGDLVCADAGVRPGRCWMGDSSDCRGWACLLIETGDKVGHVWPTPVAQVHPRAVRWMEWTRPLPEMAVACAARPAQGGR